MLLHGPGVQNAQENPDLALVELAGTAWMGVVLLTGDDLRKKARSSQLRLIQRLALGTPVRPDSPQISSFARFHAEHSK